MTARIRFSVTPSRAAISAIETPRLRNWTILPSRLALSSRAARRASIERSRGGAGGGLCGLRHICSP